LRLAAFNKPVAMLDELGDFVLPLRLRANPMVQVYSIEGVAAGKRIARYLAALGHTSIVYLSYMHASKWSADRFDGIVAQFSRMGFTDNVHLVSSAQSIRLQQTLAASGLDDEEIRQIIAIGRTPAQAKDLERTWRSEKETRQGPPFDGTGIDAELQKSFSLLSTIIHQKPEPDVLKILCNATLDAIGLRVFDMELEPLFKNALAFKDATAWVCANDGAAMRALSFLGKAGVQVPRDLSVVGFDNVPVSALERRLTTLDFNATGFVHHMLNFILRPPKPRGPYRHKAIEIEGIVLERDTTGPAPLPA
jgi:DNA-binding LacI/PurR family transcriptional regulator